MKTALFALSAMALASAAAPALAESSPRALQWIEETSSKLNQQLAVKTDPTGAAVDVSFVVDGDRRLNNGKVVVSSGSRDYDDSVVAAARRVKAPSKPPVELQGRRVTFHIAPDGAVTRTAAR